MPLCITQSWNFKKRNAKSRPDLKHNNVECSFFFFFKWWHHLQWDWIMDGAQSPGWQNILVGRGDRGGGEAEEGWELEFQPGHRNWVCCDIFPKTKPSTRMSRIFVKSFLMFWHFGTVFFDGFLQIVCNKSADNIWFKWKGPSWNRFQPWNLARPSCKPPTDNVFFWSQSFLYG